MKLTKSQRLKQYKMGEQTAKNRLANRARSCLICRVVPGLGCGGCTLYEDGMGCVSNKKSWYNKFMNTDDKIEADKMLKQRIKYYQRKIRELKNE